MNISDQGYGPHSPQGLSRRQFVTGCAAGAALLGLSPASFASKPAASSIPVLAGRNFDLDIGYLPVNFTGVDRTATVINGGLPGPILRWKEGERVTLRVHNRLAHDTSIHWHGLILPYQMDGVPGLSFDGILPGEHFEYQFDVNQSGTYWYHSHSGFQEQTGVYGAIVIDPAGPDPVAYDRDHVVLLSDWSDESPEHIYATLKKASHYYNFWERTAADLWRDIREKGVRETWRDRAMWNQMRMSDSDLSDVTGYTYTYLMNGSVPDTGWVGLFRPGERVRLRFINGSAMTLFDVQIPGLKMTVVATDGQNIEPVTVDEFRIGTAETYDVIVEPEADAAYTVFAQSMDRTGYARGTLTPNPEWRAEVPKMDHVVRLGHGDMGMDHGAHAGHGAVGSDESDAHAAHAVAPDPHNMRSMHGTHDGKPATHDMHRMHGQHHGHHSMHQKHGMHHGQNPMHHGHQGQLGHKKQAESRTAGHGSTAAIVHMHSELGPHVDMRAEAPQSGLSDPGVGLREHQARYGRRVLTYADLYGLEPTRDRREPEREIQLHLTGNMSRYMWSLNGIKFADAEPLMLKFGERVRITLVNDTMMTHPIHLHGLWSELETGNPDRIPRKHTVLVQPGSKISYLVTADALGRWAYHCHLMYHMPGMMREVRVARGDAS